MIHQPLKALYRALIFDGRTTEAMTVYLTVTGVSLKAAKAAIEAVIDGFSHEDWAELRAYQAEKRKDV